MPYEWEEWALRALAGVQPYEVRQALEAKQRWPRPAAGVAGLQVLTVWARTHDGRPLIVAGAPRPRLYLENHRRAGHGRRRAGRVHPMGADAMSDNQHLPSTPEEAAALMNNLTFDPPPTPEREAELLASLPEAAEVMVVRSLRMPIDLDEAVAAAAKEAGVTKTAWIRQAIEIVLTMQSDDDQPISRADALRALTLLRPVRRAA
ncbi:hypothetical protein ABZ570_25425 [Micromonospora sp. NPDC007271]|uniref:hypothetical protein n=1 Tax=Micromonospora sp. NPDC007271 TaxID=3154587 RepID=UPI0033C76416